MHVFLPRASAQNYDRAQENRQCAGAALIGQEDVEIAPQIFGRKQPF
jgi:hypothetical protein